jgi:hypothetical protein
MTGTRNEITDLIYKKHFAELFAAILHIEHHNQFPSQFLQVLYQQRTAETMQSVLQCMSESMRFPSWAKGIMTLVLCELIVKEDGVYSLCLVLSIEKEKAALNLDHFEKISQLLVHCPSKTFSPPKFYPRVITQLLQILRKYPIDSEFARMVSFVLVSFFSRKPKMASALIVPDLLAPLFRYMKPQASLHHSKDLDGKQIILDEDELELALTTLEKLLVGNEPNSSLIHEFNAALLPLVSLYQYARKSKSSIFQCIHQILSTIARLADSSLLIAKLLETLQLTQCQKVCEIKPGPHGGLVLVANDDCYQEFEKDALIEFFKSLDNPTLIGDLFVGVVEAHLTMNRNPEEYKEETVVFFASLILDFLDTFGENLLKRMSQILKFVRATLLDDDVENLHMGLTLLTQLMGPNDQPLQFDDEETQAIQEIGIILSTLMDHDVTSIAALASKLRVRIMTSGKAQPKNKSLELFRLAVKELSDELLPIRAHGMSVIRQLVLTKDCVAEEHLESIITIYLDLIQDEDSFIYLNAIKGCSALAESYPVQTIDRMVARYKDREFPLDVRLRMGESILQIIQRAGESFPILAERLLLTITSVLREEDPRLQSSALILSSFIAKQAPLVLLPILYQMLDFLLMLFVFQKEVAPKRGALVFLSNLVRSLGFEFGTHVERSWFLKIREMIERIAEDDTDLICRGHAQSIQADLAQFV